MALDRILASPRPVSATRGLISAYGWIYQTWACEEPNKPLREIVRSAFRLHAINNGIISAEEPRFGNAYRGLTLNLAQASRLLGFGFDRTRLEIRNHGLLPPPTRPGVGATLSHNTIDEIAKRLNDRIGSSQLRAMLGIGRSAAEAIGQSRLFDRKVSAKGKISFSRAEVQEFIDHAIFDHTEGSYGLLNADKNAVPLSRASVAYHVPYDMLCNAISIGKLKILRIRNVNKPLSSALVFPEEVKQLQTAASVPLRGAARALGIHFDTARDLVKLGLLQSSGRRQYQRYRIQPSDLEVFRSRYVSSKEAARLLGSSRRPTSALFRSMGLRPSVQPPQCRQIFFDRVEVMRKATGQ